MIHYNDWLYKLKPVYESEPGWWKLRWKPIKNGTWNIHCGLHNPFHKWTRRKWGFGIVLWKGGAHNGWGRAWEDLNLIIHLGPLGAIDGWIIWNVRCMAEGPGDCKDRRPLDIPEGVAK